MAELLANLSAEILGPRCTWLDYCFLQADRQAASWLVGWPLQAGLQLDEFYSAEIRKRKKVKGKATITDPKYKF